MSASLPSPAPGSNSPEINTYMQQNEVKQEGTTYSKEATLSSGRTITVSLHYSGEVTKADQLHNDMEKTIKKMVAAAEVVELGVPGKAEKISITRDEQQLRVEYADHSFKTEANLKKEFGDQDSRTRTIEDVKTIFAYIIGGTSFSPASSRTVSVSATDDDNNNLSLDGGVGSPQLLSSTATTTAASASSGLQEIDQPTDVFLTQSEAGKAVETVINQLKVLSVLQGQAKLEEYKKISKSLDEMKESELTTKNLMVKYKEYLSSQKQQQDVLRNEKVFFHNNLLKEMQNLQKKYNQATGEDKEALGREIRQLNAMQAQLNLSTSKIKAAESQVMMLGAVIEKRFALLKEIAPLVAEVKSKQLKLNNAVANKEKDQLKNEIKKLTKEIEGKNRELIKLPSDGYFGYKFTDQANEISRQLTESQQGGLVYTPVEAKKVNKYPKELECAQEYLNEALRSPMNWTPIYQAAILFSSEGKAYTSETILTPEGLDEQGGGVPAGLREEKKYEATNLWKTTHVLYGDDRAKISETVSFRGGQFPTLLAAAKALFKILDERKVTSLHINSLLTPTELTFIKDDRNLLAAHNANIREAFDTWILSAASGQIKINHQTYTKEELEHLRDGLMVTNLGVNEGAVGQQPIGKTGIFANIRVGWHTSIGEYTNPAIEKFNRRLTEMFGMPKPTENIGAELEGVEMGSIASIELSLANQPFINNLGALVHVGMELEEIWARNDFADATKGNDQFKMAAYWKVMDMLLGTTSYTNCMSGKDRTGEVEGAAQHLYSEIMMKQAEHKAKIKEKMEKSKSETIFTVIEEDINSILNVSGVLTVEDIDKLFIKLLTAGVEEHTKLINEFVKKKIQDAGRILNNGNLLEPKGITERHWIRSISPNLLGIPKTIPKRSDKATEIAQFPAIAPLSYYNNTTDAKQRHYAAQNRRNQMLASVEVSRVSTTQGGFKLKVNKHLARVESGFDRKYVRGQLLLKETLEQSDKPEVMDLLGLYELDKTSQDKYFQNIADALTEQGNKRIDALNKVIKQVEMEKAQSFVPQAKVKA